MSKFRLSVALCLVATSLLWSGEARAATCGAAAAPGGEWPSYSADLSNTRNQTAENLIGPGSVGALQVNWAFNSNSTDVAGGALGFSSTPVVAGGCLFAGSSGGAIYAMDAVTGNIEWAKQVDGGTYGVAVADGRVYANLSAGAILTSGVAAVALDQATGDTLWQTVIDTDSLSYTNASAVPFDGMLFVGISGPEDGPGDDGVMHPGGFAILDAATGAILKRTYTIPRAEQELGYWGAAIWGTAIINEGFAYVGTGQPANKNKEHNLSNALVKIDVRPSSPTFGEILDAYKGQPDSYLYAPQQTEACRSDLGGLGGYGNCGALDLDFGASPTLFSDDRGNTIVGNLQKSGVYHAVYADTMQGAWQTTLSAPAALANAGSSANDGESVYVVATPGVLYAMDPVHGGIKWAAPVADGTDYHPVSVANGVVYTIGNHGLLLAYDAATGLLLNAKSMAADTADVCTSLAGGVSIAANRVYSTCDVGVQGGGWIVTYGV